MLQNFMYVHDIKDFDTKKSEVLQGIEKLGVHSAFEDKQRISNTDWFLNPNINRSYMTPLKSDIDSVLACVIEGNLDVDGFNLAVTNFWFQQYEAGDFHNWHIHALATYSAVVFIELASGAETQFKIKNQVLSYPVKEGQILVFPSSFVHRSPQNTSGHRKTIVSFNMEAVG